jgi:uncharacterized protein (TIGR00290 family)
MLREDGAGSRSHGLPPSVLSAQADALGLPLILRSATWSDYEAAFLDAVAEATKHGAVAGVFGDMDVAAHRDWVVQTCETAGIAPHLPLWQMAREAELREILDLGYRARVVSCRADVPGAGFLGRPVDDALIGDCRALGIDPSGENGEYHTVVEDGPCFLHPVPLVTGDVSVHADYCFLDVTVASSAAAS